MPRFAETLISVHDAVAVKVVFGDELLPPSQCASITSVPALPWLSQKTWAGTARKMGCCDFFNCAWGFVMSRSPPELGQRRYGKSCVKVFFVLLMLSDELMHCDPRHCILSLPFMIFKRRTAWLNSWVFYILTIGSLLSLETGAEEAFLHLQVAKKFFPFLPLGCSNPHKGLMSWALGKPGCGCTSDRVITVLPKLAALLWAEGFT